MRVRSARLYRSISGLVRALRHSVRFSNGKSEKNEPTNGKETSDLTRHTFILTALPLYRYQGGVVPESWLKKMKRRNPGNGRNSSGTRGRTSCSVERRAVGVSDAPVLRSMVHVRYARV